MTAQGLASGVLALFTAGGFVVVTAAGDPGGAGIRVYDGQVIDTPAAFVVVNQRIPNVTERSEARTRLAHRCYILVTVTAATAEGVRRIAQDVIDSLEGARVAADSWQTSPIGLLNAREPVEDRDVQPAGGRWPMYSKLELDYTATLA